MWPFTKKEPKPEAQELKPPVAIGERFKYLGIEMVCCRHFNRYDGFMGVVAEYVTNHGEIKQATFYRADWVALEAERKR